MKHTIPLTVAAGLLAGTAAFALSGQAAFAQSGPAAPQQGGPTAPAAIATSSAQTPAAPVPGSNSYTEGEARARIQNKGYANVSGLQKDDKGIWRATAMKDGRSASVALDYQGNVVSN